MGRALDVNPLAVRRVSDPGTPCAHKHANHTLPTHTYSTLVYLQTGQNTFEQNGLWQIGPGDVMLIPAGQPHRRVATSESEYWGLGICMPCFGTDPGLARLNLFEHVRNGASAVATIAPERRAYLVQLFQELAAQEQATADHHTAVQRSLLTLILNEISTARAGHTHTASADSGVVAETLRFIEHNCLQPLTLQQVARAVGRSGAYVTTALSQATGKSVVEWIIAYRMAEARTLLRHSQERVSVIAERVGYTDATHFIRMFRRDTGVTPTAFRAAARRA